MGNSWNGMLFENIAREGISTLENELIPLMGFTTDFSTEIPPGKVVNTRIVPAATAPTDLVDDEGGSYASVTDDQATVSVPVTLDPHPVNGFVLTDTEAQEISAGVWADTAKRLVRTHVRSISNAVLNSVFNLLTTANYTNESVIAEGAFDADDTATIWQKTTDLGWDLSENPIMPLKPTYYSALLQDNAIQDRSASGAEALQTGRLPNLSGFRVIPAPTLPPSGGTPESENLVGFTALPQALAIAMRGVDTQDRSRFLHYEILRGPVTGAVITYSAIWTSTKRQVEHIFEALYGVAKGDGNAAYRIVSS